MKKRCSWTTCWWGAVVVPGGCAKGGNMQDPECPLYLSEEEKCAELERLYKGGEYWKNWKKKEER